MKITERIPTEMYAYFEIEFDSLEEFKGNYAKIRDAINDKIPKPEPIPHCSICQKPMMKSVAGRYYCKHLVDGKVEWGTAEYPEPELKETEKKFLKDFNN